MINIPIKDPILRKKYEQEYYQRNKNKIIQRAEQWRKDNPDKVLHNKREWNKNNKDKLKEYDAKVKLLYPDKVKGWQHKANISEGHKQSGIKWRNNLRYDVFSHYCKGEPRCECCGENIIEFLSIDHINNNGAEERKRLGWRGRGKAFYYWLVKNNYPEGYQVLCCNCNHGKWINKGICPHKITTS